MPAQFQYRAPPRPLGVGGQAYCAAYDRPVDLTFGDAKMRARLLVLAAIVFAVLAGIVAWVLNAPSVNHWLAVHTGIADMSGPYYAFWSGFGSDIAEFSLVGTAVTGVYQLNRKFNCHQRGCWRIGTHPAAGGQFLLCSRHHPDYQGKKPTREMIEQLHRLHIERAEALTPRARQSEA